MDYDPAEHAPTWRSVGAGVLLYLALIGGLAALPRVAEPDAFNAKSAPRNIALHGGFMSMAPPLSAHGAVGASGCG
jgi:hypothetical protein